MMKFSGYFAFGLLRLWRLSGLLVLLVGGQSVSAAWQTAGNFARLAEQKANYVVLQTTTGARLRVEFFDLDTIRVRLAPRGEFETFPEFAFDASAEREPPLVKFARTRDKIVLTNAAGARVEINKAPLAVTVFDENGEAVVRDARPMAFDSSSGAVAAYKSRRALTETYYGFGEKAFSLSRDGQVVTNWNTDAYLYTWGTDPLYQSIPFFIALDQGKSYGLYFNNTFRTTFDMGKTAPTDYSLSAQGGELDYFVFTGGRDRSPKKVLADYASLTGTMPLPPLWSLGNQQSRFSYFPAAKVREIAGEYRRRKIPADAIYIDIDYMDGFRIFTWDRGKFPDPSALMRDLDAQGFRAILILNPAVKIDENFALYREAKERDYFVKTPDGRPFEGAVWAGKSVFLDFINPEVRAWWGPLYRKNVEEGVSGFWNDMNEPSNFPDGNLREPIVANHPQKTIPLDAVHNAGPTIARGRESSTAERRSGKRFAPRSVVNAGATHARFHNVYGLQMARATFEGLRRLAPEKRPYVLSRAGFSGIQRYAAVWTGDNTANWEHLRLSLPMLLNMSVSGVPFVGADIGGYTGNPSGELFARWVQSAVFHPLFRPHAEKGTIDKEPWAFGPEFERINRESIELRYRFLPYLYTLFREHERTGSPVIRPLWYEYPQDHRTYLLEDQYLVGRDLLVAPVLREGERKRAVYFPAGDDWRDWRTGALYKGGASAEIDAPLDRLPFFVRAGAVIPTQPIVQHTGEMASAPLTLNVVTGIAAGRVETAAVWQDAGEGYGYRRSDWRELGLEHRRGLLKISRAGDFAGQPVRFVEALGVERRPTEMRIDGRAAENLAFDAATRRLRVEIDDAAREISLKP